MSNKIDLSKLDDEYCRLTEPFCKTPHESTQSCSSCLTAEIQDAVPERGCRRSPPHMECPTCAGLFPEEKTRDQCVSCLRAERDVKAARTRKAYRSQERHLKREYRSRPRAKGHKGLKKKH